MANQQPGKTSTDRGGQGQSGFGAGFGNDGFENQQDRMQRSRGYDDRFQGRTIEDRAPEEHAPTTQQTVAPASEATDDERRDQIHKAFRERELDASQVEVAVQGADVALTGVVVDHRAKRLAQDCAAQVAGVKTVRNELRVVSA